MMTTACCSANATPRARGNDPPRVREILRHLETRLAQGLQQQPDVLVSAFDAVERGLGHWKG